MRYVSWAAFYEGTSDALYLDVLLPRVIRDLIAREGICPVEIPDVPAIKLGSSGRTVDKIAQEACSFRQAVDVIFIHGDTGGRSLEGRLADRTDAYCAKMMAVCDWPRDRCITITPRHETEAWLLADGEAVTKALGYNGAPEEVGLPVDAVAAERLRDPKLVLTAAIEKVAGHRRAQKIDNLFPAVAQRQRLELLRRSDSFAAFEARLRGCLRSLGCVQD
jgi:hypothetical protein